MSNKQNEIIFLNPVFTHNIWGGRRLKEEFGYDIDGDDIGECWGISAHHNGDCTVKGGSFDGMRLSELYNTHRELFGKCKSEVFPLLVKIIDANDDLSIQVHPDDSYAAAHENGALGKKECWYILDCPKQAVLVAGHNARTKEELVDMINEGRWEELIRKVPVHKGDFIQIDPGTVHAITSGCLILETQQNSDITYRLYDYDRISDGRKRPLHIAQSIDVITVPAQNAQKSVIHPENTDICRLIECDKYDVYRIIVSGTMEPEIFGPQENTFWCCTVILGEGIINDNSIKKGDNFIIPSGYDGIKLCGEMEIIMSSAK